LLPRRAGLGAAARQRLLGNQPLRVRCQVELPTNSALLRPQGQKTDVKWNSNNALGLLSM